LSLSLPPPHKAPKKERFFGTVSGTGDDICCEFSDIVAGIAVAAGTSATGLGSEEEKKTRLLESVGLGLAELGVFLFAGTSDFGVCESFLPVLAKPDKSCAKQTDARKHNNVITVKNIPKNMNHRSDRFIALLMNNYCF
jgi:hypothetical protein